MEEYNLKTKVVGVDISNELTTYAIVDVRGTFLLKTPFQQWTILMSTIS